MEAGLTIYNEAHTLQIDSQYRNFVLVSKRDYSQNSVIEQAGTIFALSGTGYISDGVGSDNRLWIYGSGTIYGFALAGQPQNQNLGLQVFDANGNTCFTSSSKPMRVIDMINGAFFNQSKPLINKDYGVVKCAICYGQPYVAWVENGSYKIGVFDSNISSGVTLSPIAMISTNQSTYQNTALSKYIGEYNHLILDVSYY